MTTWTCPICAGRTCAAASPCGDVWSGRTQATRLPRAELVSTAALPPAVKPAATLDGLDKRLDRTCTNVVELFERVLRLEWGSRPEGAPKDDAASPATPHGTSEGSKAPPTPPSVAGISKPEPVGGPTFWQPAHARQVPGPTSATTLERLVADNRALTEQVTRLQEDGNARLALARIRKVLELPEGASDQELVDEVARIRSALVAVWGGTSEPKPTIDRTAFVNRWIAPSGPYRVKVRENPDEWFTPKDQPDPTMEITLSFRAPREECKELQAISERGGPLRVRLEPAAKAGAPR